MPTHKFKKNSVDYIYNKTTKNYVKRTGRIGRQILMKRKRKKENTRRRHSSPSTSSTSSEDDSMFSSSASSRMSKTSQTSNSSQSSSEKSSDMGSVHTYDSDNTFASMTEPSTSDGDDSTSCSSSSEPPSPDINKKLKKEMAHKKMHDVSPDETSTNKSVPPSTSPDKLYSGTSSLNEDTHDDDMGVDHLEYMDFDLDGDIHNPLEQFSVQTKRTKNHKH